MCGTRGSEMLLASLLASVAVRSHRAHPSVSLASLARPLFLGHAVLSFVSAVLLLIVELYSIPKVPGRRRGTRGFPAAPRESIGRDHVGVSRASGLGPMSVM